MPRQSLLVIGGTGRMGVQVIHSAYTQFSEFLTVHAFVRTPSKLTDDVRRMCKSVVVGDASRRADLERALGETGADAVVIAVGAGDDISKTDIRTTTAKALARVVRPGGGWDHVRVVVVSSLGSGGSKIKAGFGVGMLVSFHLRHIIADHDGQEAAFKHAMAKQADSRLLIVRPTNLTENSPSGVDHVTVFADNEKVPSMHIDRADVAEWILARLCTGEATAFGGSVNLSSV